jgi:membrane associated rhomboid family serine protease
MLPLWDSTPRKTFPFINYLIIALNIIVFFYEVTSPDFASFVEKYAFVPANFYISDLNSWLPVFSALFIHGSFIHILSNMWFLHLFGDNVEDRVGHFPYLLFYLVGGFIANIAQYLLDPSSVIPLVGASGAISAVAGAYFVLYRNSNVKTLIPIFFIPAIIDLPVWLFLGYWFVIQIFSGIGSLATMPLQDGGVAWFAHVGGFIFGYLFAQTLKPVKEVEEGEIIST